MATANIRSRRHRTRRRFRLEHLEARRLLTTFQVVTPGDTPFGSCSLVACTLRDAVAAANNTTGPDEITFDPFVLKDSDPSNETYSILLNSTLNVTDSLTITGFAGAQLSISGQDSARIFQFDGPGANTYNLKPLGKRS